MDQPGTQTTTIRRHHQSVLARIGASAVVAIIATSVGATSALGQSVSGFPTATISASSDTVVAGQPFVLHSTYGPTLFASDVSVAYYELLPSGELGPLVERQLIPAAQGAMVTSVSAPITPTEVGYRTYTVAFSEPLVLFMSPGDPAVVHVVDSTTLLTRSSGIGFVTLRATLTADYDGAPLPGRSIDFTSGNRHLCTATTNSDGVASCQAFGLLGTYTASYAGEEHYLPSEDQDRFL